MEDLKCPKCGRKLVFEGYTGEMTPLNYNNSIKLEGVAVCRQCRQKYACDVYFNRFAIKNLVAVPG